MKKLWFLYLSFAQFSVFAAPGFHPQYASEFYTPRHNIASATALRYTYQQYNAANSILEGVVASKLMLGASTDSARENFRETLKILGFEGGNLDQLVDQLGVITNDNLRSFSTRYQRSTLEGFYSEEATSLLDLPRENIKEDQQVLYSPQEYNVANYLLRVLFEAQEKVNSYVDTKDFAEILTKLQIVKEDVANQLVLQLIGSDQQINSVAMEARTIADRRQLIQSLLLTIKDASGQSISHERAFLLCKSLGLYVNASQTSAPPPVSSPSETRSDERVSFPRGEASAYSFNNGGIVINGARYTFDGNGSVTIGGNGSVTIGGARSSEDSHSSDRTINGSAGGNSKSYTRCTINGSAGGNNATYTNCKINGSAGGNNATYTNCKITGNSHGNNASYTNCQIMGNRSPSATYISCIFPNERSNSSTSSSSRQNVYSPGINISGGVSISGMSMSSSGGSGTSMTINGNQISANSQGVFVNGRRVSERTGAMSVVNDAVFINGTQVYP